MLGFGHQILCLSHQKIEHSYCDCAFQIHLLKLKSELLLNVVLIYKMELFPVLSPELYLIW